MAFSELTIDAVGNGTQPGKDTEALDHKRWCLKMNVMKSGVGGCRMKFGFECGEVQASPECFRIATTLLIHVHIVDPLDVMRKAIHKRWKFDQGGSYTSQKRFLEVC